MVLRGLRLRLWLGWIVGGSVVVGGWRLLPWRLIQLLRLMVAVLRVQRRNGVRSCCLHLVMLIMRRLGRLRVRLLLLHRTRWLNMSVTLLVCRLFTLLHLQLLLPLLQITLLLLQQSQLLLGVVALLLVLFLLRLMLLVLLLLGGLAFGRLAFSGHSGGIQDGLPRQSRGECLVHQVRGNVSRRGPDCRPDGLG